jgi:hypothetical protein
MSNNNTTTDEKHIAKPAYERPELTRLDVKETKTGNLGPGEDALFTFLS